MRNERILFVLSNKSREIKILIEHHHTIIAHQREQACLRSTSACYVECRECCSVGTGNGHFSIIIGANIGDNSYLQTARYAAFNRQTRTGLPNTKADDLIILVSDPAYCDSIAKDLRRFRQSQARQIQSSPKYPTTNCRPLNYRDLRLSSRR